MPQSRARDSHFEAQLSVSVSNLKSKTDAESGYLGLDPEARSRDTAPERSTPKHVALTWARRLKRVFGIEIEQCVRCGGKLKVIASIEEPEVIQRILTHRRERGDEETSTLPLGSRAPPQTQLL